MGTIDLVAKLKIEQIKMGNCHPAHKNALKCGVLTGLKLGLARIKSGLQRDEKLEEILSSTMSLPDLLDKANDFMPVGFFFTSEMFVSVAYRTSMSQSYYCDGIKLGYSYVMDLEEEFEEVTPVPLWAISLTSVHITEYIEHAVTTFG